MEKVEAYNKEAIFDKLILALLEEFDRIRFEIQSAKYTKHKPQLWNNLFRCAETLRDLLMSRPDKGEVDEWLDIIAQKAPKKFVKYAKRLVEKSYRDASPVKFTDKVQKDASRKISK